MFQKVLTVAELIAELQKHPPDAPVFFKGSEWDHAATNVEGGYDYGVHIPTGARLIGVLITSKYI